jgi:MerR family redox-sensitive transcriptional activator SoxR
MKIGELARKSGFRPSTIRFYESAGLLPPALRHNGQRRFAADVESYLSVIAFARKAGFTLAEIKVLRSCSTVSNLELRPRVGGEL